MEAAMTTTLKDKAEVEADTELTLAATLVQVHPDDPLVVKRAISLLEAAIDIYYKANNYRKAAMTSVLLSQLYSKQKRYYIALGYMRDALDYLDQKLDKELFLHCRMLLPSLEALSRNECSSVEIPMPISAGTAFNGFSMATDDNAAPHNKPHIIINKPPIVVPMDHGPKKAKKRPEARKPKNPKTAQPPTEETNVDFIKAAVAGKLFNDDDNT
jgi:tetratricopeptide (TPR) repeat protein